MLNPYIRIMRAAKKGVGVRLSPEEVQFMSFDSAIETAAGNTESGIEICNGTQSMNERGIIKGDDNNG